MKNNNKIIGFICLCIVLTFLIALQVSDIRYLTNLNQRQTATENFINKHWKCENIISIRTEEVCNHLIIRSNEMALCDGAVEIVYQEDTYKHYWGCSDIAFVNETTGFLEWEKEKRTKCIIETTEEVCKWE